MLFVYYDQMDTDEALVISIIETLIYNSSSPPSLPIRSFLSPPPLNLAMEKELEVRCVNLWACRKLSIDLTLKLSRSDG